MGPPFFLYFKQTSLCSLSNQKIFARQDRAYSSYERPVLLTLGFLGSMRAFGSTHGRRFGGVELCLLPGATPMESMMLPSSLSGRTYSFPPLFDSIVTSYVLLTGTWEVAVAYVIIVAIMAYLFLLLFVLFISDASVKLQT